MSSSTIKLLHESIMHENETILVLKPTHISFNLGVQRRFDFRYLLATCLVDLINNEVKFETFAAHFD